MSLVDIDDVRKAAMHSAAERARLRRQQEEEEREKEKERARRKAAELEAKMKAGREEKESEGPETKQTEAKVSLKVESSTHLSRMFASIYRLSRSSRTPCNLFRDLPKPWSQFQKNHRHLKHCLQSRLPLFAPHHQKVHFALHRVAVLLSPLRQMPMHNLPLRKPLRGAVKRCQRVLLPNSRRKLRRRLTFP